MREIAFAFGVLMVAGLSTTAIAEEPKGAAAGHAVVRDDVKLYYELAGSAGAHVGPEVVSPSEVSAKIVDCGEIVAGPHEGTAEAPDTELGHVDVMDAWEVPQFKPGCPNIEASIGTRFGVSVIASGAPDFSIIPLVTRVTHPEIRNPESGRKTSVDQWASPMNAEIPRYAGWSFDKPWELVRGRWRIEILDERGRVLVAQDFNVRLKR